MKKQRISNRLSSAFERKEEDQPGEAANSNAFYSLLGSCHRSRFGIVGGVSRINWLNESKEGALIYENWWVTVPAELGSSFKL